MLVLNLPEDIERRLEALAEWTGRTKAFFIRAAIEGYLNDLVDSDLAEERLKGPGTSKEISLATLQNKLSKSN